MIDMRNRTTILCCVIGLLCCVQPAAAYRPLAEEYRHFLSVDAALGYASLHNNSGDLHSGNGTALNIGCGYRIAYRRFLFAVGIEGSYLFNTHSMSDARGQFSMMDTEGDDFIMHVDATQGSDVCHLLSGNIPVLFGAEFGRFYFLLGPEIACNLMGKTVSQSRITTTGEYDRYIGIFENMPNHRLETIATNSGLRSFNLGVDVLLHLEIGGRIGHLPSERGEKDLADKRCYLALFADYGLLNLRRQQLTGDRIGYTETGQGVQFYVTPTLLCNSLHSARLNQYMVGIKATFLLELPKRKPCILCTD